MREFPSEYLDLSVDQLLKDAQGGVQNCRKGEQAPFRQSISKISVSRTAEDVQV
jgi:hypothetical protein